MGSLGLRVRLGHVRWPSLFSSEASENAPAGRCRGRRGHYKAGKGSKPEPPGIPPRARLSSSRTEYENVAACQAVLDYRGDLLSSRAERPDVCEGRLIEPAISRGTVPAKYLPGNSIQGALASQYLSAASRTGIRIDSRHGCAVYFGCVSPDCSGAQRPGTLRVGEKRKGVPCRLGPYRLPCCCEAARSRR